VKLHPNPNTIGNTRFAGKAYNALSKAHTAKKVSAKAALSSAFYRALGKADKVQNEKVLKK
jgi:hypothetical protein